jgi:hypothetical protein
LLEKGVEANGMIEIKSIWNSTKKLNLLPVLMPLIVNIYSVKEVIPWRDEDVIGGKA